MKKCLVTGATGFVGANLLHALAADGEWDVRASGMHGDSTKQIDGKYSEYIPADITIVEEVEKIVAGCEIVFHVAGDTSFWKKRYALQRRINVDGTVNVAEACLKFGVRRLVYTSTQDVLGYDPGGKPVTEETGSFNFDNMGYNYGETKLEAWEKIKAFTRERGLDAVSIFPGFMIGPFDHTLQIGRLFFDLKNGDVPGFIVGGSSYCHVAEVARAHIAAAKKGRKGEGYICAGNRNTNLTHKEVWTAMGNAVGARLPKLTLPRWVFIAYGYVMGWLSDLTGKPPEMDPGMARYLTVNQWTLSDKAERELGYRVPPIEKCIQDALAWYRANGYDI